jgi:hypothetical protein
MDRTLIAYIEMVQYSEASPFDSGSSLVVHFLCRGTSFLLRVAGHVPSPPTSAHLAILKAESCSVCLCVMILQNSIAGLLRTESVKERLDSGWTALAFN